MKIKLFLWVLILSMPLTAQVFTHVDTHGKTNNQPETNKSVTNWLHYDNNVNSSAYGVAAMHLVGAYIKLPANMMTAYINREIEQVKVYIGSDAANNIPGFTVKIYSDLNATPLAEKYCSLNQSLYTAGDWNTVVLDTPVLIDGSDLYVGFEYYGAGNIMGVDDGSAFVSGVNYYYYDGFFNLWDNVATKNFNIQVGINGSLTANDVAISNVNIDEYISVGSTDIEATISNFGSTVLNSVDFNYKVDNGTVNTDNLTGLNLDTGQSITVTHSIPWDATSGFHDLDVYVSNFNGNGNDDIDTNNHQEIEDIKVLDLIYPRNAVFEFPTATWSGWAPMGIATIKDMYHTYNDGSFIAINVHFFDGMHSDDYIPSSMYKTKLNRKSYKIIPEYSEIEYYYLKEINIPPIGKIDFQNITWDNNTRELTATVSTKFAMDILNNNQRYNVSLIIVENNVTGVTDVNNDFDQRNYYSNNIHLVDWEGIDYYNLPDPIDCSQMVYNNVERAIVGGFDGISYTFPYNITLIHDTAYDYTFNYTLATNIDENNVYLVALIIDRYNGEIVNGSQIDLSTAIRPYTQQVLNDFEIFPNPATNRIKLTGVKNTDITIYDMMGNLILKRKSSNESLRISLDNFTGGVYLINFTKDHKTITKKLVVNK